MTPPAGYAVGIPRLFCSGQRSFRFAARLSSIAREILHRTASGRSLGQNRRAKRQPIDDFSFSFIAPLRTYHHYISQIIFLSTYIILNSRLITETIESSFLTFLITFSLIELSTPINAIASFKGAFLPKLKLAILILSSPRIDPK